MVLNVFKCIYLYERRKVNEKLNIDRQDLMKALVKSGMKSLENE